ncbi:MAG TPA: hypothetical protein DCG38_05825 [Eubacteriaceae bacterium]|nr:hypothetical protein [Eubacteriaceae bacterium]
MAEGNIVLIQSNVSELWLCILVMGGVNVLMEDIDLYAEIDNFERYKSVKSILIKGDLQAVKDPFVSIVIPTYKRPSLLKEAINSALNQKDANCEYEVVVVDNDSTFDIETETDRLIRTYSDKRLYYYKNEKNLGMFGNWNRCIELARGRWVAFLHDDDLLREDYISKIRELLMRRKNIGAIMPSMDCIGGAKTVNQDKKIRNLIKYTLKKIYYAFLSNRLMKLNYYDSYILQSNVYGAPTCGAIFMREYLTELGGFDEDYFPSADWFFLIKFNRKYEVYRAFEKLGYYRYESNETLNLATLKAFVEDAYKFRCFVKQNSLLGRLWVCFFEKEIHKRFVDWVVALDRTQSISPDDFNHLTDYEYRKVRYKLFKYIVFAYMRLNMIRIV